MSHYAAIESVICTSCNHLAHDGPCPVLVFYGRGPTSPPGNQQCLCGHPAIQQTITTAPDPRDEQISALQQQVQRLTAERDRWKTAFGDADAELESHSTDRVNQRAEVAALKRENEALRAERIEWATKTIAFLTLLENKAGVKLSELQEVREALDAAKEKGD